MFANNNHTIVRQLAYRSLFADKKRNLVAAATIALAVCVMLFLALALLGSLEVSAQLSRGYDQAFFQPLDEEQLELVQNDPGLENVSVQVIIGRTQLQDAIIRSHYVSDNNYNFRLDFAPLIGSTPASLSDIVVPRSLLHYLDYPPVTGQEILLDLGFGPERFVVSGILENEDDSRDFSVFASKEYVKARMEKPEYTARVNLRDSKGMNLAEIGRGLEEIARELGLEDRFTLRGAYFNSAGLPFASFLFLLFSSLAVALACGLVIYSMFYITVSGKTQEYGRLKVIGATSKMLRRIVRIETLCLSAMGMVAGNLVGCVIAYLLRPDGWRWPVTGVCVLLVSLLAIIAVCVSTRAPVNLAGKADPVEAVKITPYTVAGGRGETKPLQRRLTPAGLAWISFRSNPKKALFTFCSLAFAGILLMSVAAFQNSISAENMIRADFPYGDYALELDMHSDSAGAASPQANNPLDEELEQGLRGINGVTNVMVKRAVKADTELLNKMEPLLFTGLTREQMAAYTGLIVEGTADYDTLVAHNGLLIALDHCKTFREVWGHDIALGSQFIVQRYDGSKISFSIMGILSSDLKYNTDGSLLSLPDELMPTINGEIDNFNTMYIVQVAEDNENLRQRIFSMANSRSLEIVTIQDRVQLHESRMKSEIAIFYGVAAFIVLFSLMNLANTLITNLLSRQQELGVLQSIGMSHSQLKTLLRMDCLLYIAGTVLITGVLGTMAGALVCSVLEHSGQFGSVAYQFPVWVFAAYILLLLAAYDVYQFCAVRICTKRPLIERINVQ